MADISPTQQEINALLNTFAQEHYREAKILATAMTQNYPLHGLSWMALGEAQINMGNTTEALFAMQEAAKLLPHSAEAQYSLGLTLRLLKQLKEAESSFRSALQLRPDYPEAHNSLGTTLRDMGQATLAEASIRAALQYKPDYAEAHYNLGMTRFQMGRTDEAIDSYRQAIAINADYVDAHINLGNILRNLGRLDDARHSYVQALQIMPEHPEAHSNLGIVLADMGLLSEAIAAYLQAIAARPAYLEAHNNLGNALFKLGRLDEAETSYRQALQIDPRNSDTHNNLGILLHEQRRLTEAVTSYRQAIASRPDYAKAHNNLGISLHDQGLFAEAEKSYQEAIRIAPSLAEAYNNLGITRYEQGNLEGARACYEKTLAIHPEFADAHSNLGTVLVALGDIPSAEKSLSTAMAIAPGEVMPLVTALSYIPYRKDDIRFSQLETLFSQRATLPLRQRIKLDFAMGKAMEHAGQHDKSFAAYEEGNRLHYQQHPFDERNDEHFLDQSRRFFTAELFAQLAGLPDRFADIDKERIPIFIVGMPRSGTTLIEQILASHPAVYGAGELTTLGMLIKKTNILSFDVKNWDTALQELRELGQTYLDQVWQLAPHSRYIINKMPSNYYHLGLINLMLPNAKIIHSLRDPVDTCFSSYALQFTHGYEFSYDLGVLGRTYGRYQQLVEHWHQTLPSGSILDLKYEDNIADPEREAQRLLAFLGLEWDSACLRFFESGRTVKTASATQVRKPIYSSSIARWKHFETHLSPLLTSLRAYS